MKTPAANRRTHGKNPIATPVSRKKSNLVLIGGAAFVLFCSLAMWSMGKDLSAKSEEMNEAVGRIKVLSQESEANKLAIKEMLETSKQLQEENEKLQQANKDLQDSNKTLQQQNGSLVKKYRESREAQEKKRKLESQKELQKSAPLTLVSARVTKTNFNKIKDTPPTGTFNASFYTPKCAGCTGKTASGAIAQPGVTIAVDTRYWKLGTKFYVEGFGIVVAQDTGSAIKGKYRVDICVSSTKEALKLGNKKLKFWVLEDV